MKIAQVVGARPQFVKLAPLSLLLRKHHAEIIIHSGQHYDIQMNEVFFRDMLIPAPDYLLEVGSGSQAQQTGEIMMALEPVLEKEKPDLVIVYGDTNTTLAGALTAAKLGLKTVHVEAGLRSFTRSMPEEINRIVADHLGDILLVPTPLAMQNAAAEGLEAKCHLVGDIMVDSLKLGLELAQQQSLILEELKLRAGDYYLLTLHRPYNVDDPERLCYILSGLNDLGRKVIFPVHPRTRNVLSCFEVERFDAISYIEPQAYLDFIRLMQSAAAIITDSGGIQKEAYILKKPCITLRYETEWQETVEAGWNLLLPVNSTDFPSAITRFRVAETHPELYGSEVAAKIIGILEDNARGN